MITHIERFKLKIVFRINEVILRKLQFGAYQILKRNSAVRVR
jgi:hypothetical protein